MQTQSDLFLSLLTATTLNAHGFHVVIHLTTLDPVAQELPLFLANSFMMTCFYEPEKEAIFGAKTFSFCALLWQIEALNYSSSCSGDRLIPGKTRWKKVTLTREISQANLAPTTCFQKPGRKRLSNPAKQLVPSNLEIFQNFGPFLYFPGWINQAKIMGNGEKIPRLFCNPAFGFGVLFSSSLLFQLSGFKISSCFNIGFAASQ